MIEQAAMAVLRLQHPARRRFALLMTVAAHRYQKTGPVRWSTRFDICTLADKPHLACRKA